ncbi:UNKNOWN [Stylonychia lemnae]|uniref:Uncharacterized protein n=1 Tax=Stylonychia lemnae TaxID=5949 RepID=A0A078AXC5_STYLE|nr:UNKNOWN [Stylonychia lemnae]|eukprot:CDW86726.1 UNKNOWN [Stylonychia lemnae]
MHNQTFYPQHRKNSLVIDQYSIRQHAQQNNSDEKVYENRSFLNPPSLQSFQMRIKSRSQSRQNKQQSIIELLSNMNQSEQNLISDIQSIRIDSKKLKNQELHKSFEIDQQSTGKQNSSVIIGQQKQQIHHQQISMFELKPQDMLTSSTGAISNKIKVFNSRPQSQAMKDYKPIFLQRRNRTQNKNSNGSHPHIIRIQDVTELDDRSYRATSTFNSEKKGVNRARKDGLISRKSDTDNSDMNHILNETTIQSNKD